MPHVCLSPEAYTPFKDHASNGSASVGPSANTASAKWMRSNGEGPMEMAQKQRDALNARPELACFYA